MLLGSGASWCSSADTVLGLGSEEELRPPRGAETPSAYVALRGLTMKYGYYQTFKIRALEMQASVRVCSELLNILSCDENIYF